ncbi:MAG: hypothetical protein ACOH2V_00015 [Candidatus Saccharimonadaceae bacterium]
MAPMTPFKMSSSGAGTPADKRTSLEGTNKMSSVTGQAADIMSAAFPKSQDPLTNTLNVGYDATANAVAAIPVYGTAISAGMKVAGAVSDGLDAATGGATAFENPGT